MSVRKREDRGGKYEASITFTHPLSGKRERFRRMTPFRSQRKAQEWEAEWRTKLNDRNYWLALREEREQGQTPTLRDFLDEFEQRVAGDVRPSTLTIYESRLRNHVLPHLGERRVDEIETKDVDALLATLRAAELAETTIRGIATALGAALTRAERWGYLESNERPDIAFPRLPPSVVSEVRYLTQAEVDRLIESAPDKLGAIIELALRTGLRIGELQGLEWADITLDRRILHVRRTWTRTGMNAPKAGGMRTVPLTNDTVELLKAHEATEWSGYRYVFGWDVEPLHRDVLRWPMDKAQEAAELPSNRRGWHVLRHTFAARLATRGVSLRLIQRLLGHASVTTTERYAHLMPQSSEMVRRFLEEHGM